MDEKNREHYCGWQPGMRDLGRWRDPAGGPEPIVRRSLDGQEVHVWYAFLEAADSRVETLAALLSEDEHERSARYRFACDRRRFILARGTLRLLLGRYLDIAPARVLLAYQAGGKPRIDGAGGLEFNLSHSRELGVYAFSRGRRVGVDVEHVDRKVDCLGLARRYFSASERAMLEGVPAEALVSEFLACWTRREALLKATGQGLRGLSRVSVPQESMQEPCVKFRGEGGDTWVLSGLRPGPEYVGALAVEGEGWNLALGTVD
jgi:4'-phosphopantetheinyl transferase